MFVPKEAKRVAEFHFKDLCESAKGSPDYMSLSKNFSTIILRNVPKFSLERRDIMRRFILLIDELYYH